MDDATYLDMQLAESIYTHPNAYRPPSCIFSSLGRACNNKQIYGCFCNEHLKLFFGLTVIQVPRRTQFDSYTSTETRFTNIMKKFIPFPYEFKYDSTTGEIDETQDICLNSEQHAQKWHAFVEQLHQASLSSEQRSKSVFQLHNIFQVISLVTPICGVLENYTYFHEFMTFINTPTYAPLMDIRWKDSKIGVKYRNTISNEEEFGFYPMSKLPPFYQILFFHTEMSTNQCLQPSPAYRVYTPNIVLDSTNFEFRVVNNSEASPLYLADEKTNEASAVVLLGECMWKNQIATWRRQPTAYVSYVSRSQQPFPKLCS